MAKSLYGMIADVASRFPDENAILGKDMELTYATLLHYSLRIAAFLRKQGVERGELVPVIAVRDCMMVLCMVALTKLDAGYVPIDASSWSKSRIQAVLETVKPRVVVNTCDWTEGAFSCESITRVQLSNAIQSPNTDRAVISWPAFDLDNPIYVIFTSGTTGKPKGVVIPHKNLLHYVQQGEEPLPFNLGVRPGDRVMTIFSVGFDAYSGVVFSTLCNGGCLVLSDSEKFEQDLCKCTILPTTPSILRTVQEPKIYPQLRSIFLGGEHPGSDLLKAWSNPLRKIYNAYGPTETTVSSTLCEIGLDRPITLGQPMRGSLLVLLDKNLEEVDEGEIAISGPGLASGYFQDSDRTQSRFITWEGRRFFLTGDFAQRTRDGMVFRGREDAMAKNRGILINLETEVISALRSHPDVVDAAALMVNDRLVAFLTPQTVNTMAIRRSLLQLHDNFHVPDIIYPVECLPLSVNGKVDYNELRKRAEANSGESCESNAYPSLEEVLASCVSSSLAIPLEDVDLDRSFYDLGGTSLSAMKLTSLLHKQYLSLSLARLFAAESLSVAVKSIERVQTQDDNVEATIRPDRGQVPMTSLQAGMLRASFSTPGAYCLVLITSFEAFDRHDCEKLRNAWRIALVRHAIFFGSFELGRGIQIMPDEHTASDIPWSQEYCVDSGKDDLIANNITSMLALTSGLVHKESIEPPLAFKMLTLPDGSAKLITLMHHSCVDGWSLAVLLNDVRDVLVGKTLPAPATFEEFSLSKRQLLRGRSATDPNLWALLLGEYHQCKGLLQSDQPPNRSLPKTPTISSEDMLDLDLTLPKLRHGARSSNVTPSAIVLSAWATVLRIFLAGSDVVFGYVFSVRQPHGDMVDRVVGPLISTLPVPIRLDSSAPRDSILRAVQEKTLRMTDNQPFLESCLNTIHGDLSNLFGSVVSLDYDLPEIPRLDVLGPCTYEHYAVMDQSLHVIIEQRAGRLFSRMRFSADCHDPEFVQSLQAHFYAAIHQFMALGHTTLDEMHHKILEVVGRPRTSKIQVDHPTSGFPPLTVRDAFNDGLSQWPDRIAVETSHDRVTYQDLDSKSEHVASLIKDMALDRKVAAVLSDGSLNWVICVIAILKLGAIYLPIDTQLPQSRIREMLEHSGATVCLSPGEEYQVPELTRNITVVPITTLLQSSPSQPPRHVNISPSDALYLIYTSGTTGHPKGVVGCHGPVYSYLTNPAARLHSEPGRRNAQMMSVGFDVSIAELFGSLCFGATLVLKDMDEPFRHLTSVDAVMATPSLFTMLVADCYTNLDTIFLAGEPVPQGLVAQWDTGPDRRLYNGYGPCECTIVVLIARLRSGDEVHLGEPVDGNRCYVLDPDLRPVPPGVAGEICIGGRSVSAGYLHDPDLTKKRFVPDPFVEGQTLYMTGDRGLWTSSGSLRFMGRVDRQVKIRGFRVEIDHVEQAIAATTSGKVQAVVVKHEDTLIAFIVPGDANVIQIRKDLPDILPYYAIPSTIVPLDSFPLTTNHKIDTRSLIKLAMHESLRIHGRQPRGYVELLIRDTWINVLNLKDGYRLDSESDFRDLGGNSLMLAKVTRNLSDHLGRVFPFSIAIRHQSLGALASALQHYLEQCDQRGYQRDTRFGKTQRQTLRLQAEIVEFSKITPACLSLHIACHLRLKGHIDTRRLQKAFQNVVAQNAILRMRFIIQGGSMMTRVSDTSEAAEVYDSAPGPVRAANCVNRPFNLELDQPIRASIFQDQAQTDLIMVVHHVIADEDTVNIILRHISKQYHELVRLDASKAQHPSIGGTGMPPGEYTPCPNHDPDPMDPQDARFWSDYLEDLPLAFTSLETRCAVVATASLRLRLRGSIVAETLLEACILAISATFSIQDVCFAVPFNMRTGPTHVDFMGPLVDRLPIRVNLADASGEGLAGVRKLVRERVQDALCHAVPYHQITSLLGRADIFDIMVVIHRRENSYDRHLDLGQLETVNIAARTSISKFPFTLEFVERENHLDCEITYNPTIYHEFRVTLFGTNLSHSLQRLSDQWAQSSYIP